MSAESQFTALVLKQNEVGKVTSRIQTLDNNTLPEGDVTVSIKYSALNYKDGLIIQGLGRLVRDYPHVSGIDFAGVIEQSESPDYKPGDEVVLTGWRVGEAHWGGHATRARVKSDWLVPLPEGLTLKQSMSIATAGLTAMLAIMTLEEHGLIPDDEGEVLVTGAAGGVGSAAVSILAGLGYTVAAGTGRAETHNYLKNLGAAVIVDRAELQEEPKGPLASQRWAACIDNVGGQMLANVLAALRYWGTVASVGNAGGIEFTANVLPFLLRGINLCGIDSSTCSKARRIIAWNRLSSELHLDKLDNMTNTAPLADLPQLAGKILQGQIQGRTVIDVQG